MLSLSGLILRMLRLPSQRTWKTFILTAKRLVHRSPHSATCVRWTGSSDWLLPDMDIVKFKPKPPQYEVPPERVLQSDHVRSLLEACETQRDRALVAVVWDSAARISEILNCNIGHVTFDRYGAMIAVTGKTGRRSIRLVSSVPDLQVWINIHPFKNNPDAPLFVTSRRRGMLSPVLQYAGYKISSLGSGISQVALRTRILMPSDTVA